MEMASRRSSTKPANRSLKSRSHFRPTLAQHHVAHISAPTVNITPPVLRESNPDGLAGSQTLFSINMKK